METFTEDTFEFQKARIVGGDEWAGVGIMCGVRGLDGLREEGTQKICLVTREGGVEEGLGEVSGVRVMVIWVTADAPPPDGQRVGNRAFGG